MCFSISYNCNVVCINGYMNSTALVNKTIASIGNAYGELTDRCSISCAEGVMDSGWGTTSRPLEIASPISYMILIVIVVAVFGLVIWYGRRAK